mgnify:CR=1 FL=1
MSLSSEDLRREIEKIESHLAWLKSQLSQLETGSPSSTVAAPPPPSAPDKAAQGHEAPVLQPVTSAAGVSPTMPEQEIELPHIPDEPQLNPMSVKIGCIASAVLFVALFLFFLFGLPYLIDFGGDEEALPEIPEDTQQIN